MAGLIGAGILFIWSMLINILCAKAGWIFRTNIVDTAILYILLMNPYHVFMEIMQKVKEDNEDADSEHICQ